MADWLKVLIGTLTGLIVGLVSEPLKGWITAKLRERVIRRALYASMADLYGFYSAKLDPAMRKQYPMAFVDENLEIFDYYCSTEKAAFYRLPEAPFIKSFFKCVRKSSDLLHEESPRSEREAATDAVIFCIKSGIQHGAINRKMLRKLLLKGPLWSKSRRHEQD